MRVMLVAAFVLGGAVAASGESAKRIDICSGHPRYWQYGGRPVLLLGGSCEDNLFQIPELEEHLDVLVAAGGNYVRCTMSSRDKGNVWAFAKAGELYDLEQWNAEYWARFSRFLEGTERRDVIVQIEIWATFDYYRGNWQVNPFNPQQNVNYSEEETGLPAVVDSHPVKTENPFFWSVPAEHNRTVLLEYQQRFVDEILRHTLPRDNVLYCMDNETSVTPEWGAYWANYIREAAARAGVSVHTTEMWDAHSLSHPQHRATFEHPETYSFVDVSQNNHQKGQTHYDNARQLRRRIVDPVRPMNNVKIYGADTGSYGSTRDGIERFWRNIFSGMATARFHRPTSGLGLGERAQRMLRSAREVTGAFDIFRCEPHNDLLGDREENEAYCLAEPGRQYAVYFPDGGDVTLDASGAGAPMGIRWYDIDAGRWQEPTDAGAETTLRLTAPRKGQWAVVVR